MNYFKPQSHTDSDNEDPLYQSSNSSDSVLENEVDQLQDPGEPVSKGEVYL